MMRKLYIPIIDNGMGLVRSQFATSWIGALAAGVVGDAIFESLSYPYPDGAMNVATAMFLESDADEMIIVDTDIIFTPDDLVWLLSHDVDLVAGLYPLKRSGLTLGVQPLLDNPEPFAKPKPYLVEVAGVGRAFMRIKRNVFDVLRDTHTLKIFYCGATKQDEYAYWQGLLGGHSEDFNLCDQWRGIGGKVYVDQRIKVRHVGTAVYPLTK